MNVKFHKNCQNTGKIQKISRVRCNFRDIRHLFSRTPMRNFLWCYYRQGVTDKVY